MKIKSNKVHTTRTAFIAVVLGVLLLLSIGYYGWSTLRNQQPLGDIDYSPATADDKRLNDSIKEDLGKDGRSPQGDSSNTDSVTSKQQVKPVISAYGQPDGAGTDFKLNGYVPEIIETDGKCTLTMVKGESTASTSKASLQNAQNTSCGQLIVPFEKLSAGTWQAVLSYESSMSSGSSATTQVEIK